MAQPQDKPSGYGFGTFQGVFTPSILTIIGVVMYLRFGWMLGNVGLATSLLIVTIGSSITFLTGLSISALATNMRMKGGGAYFMLSRSLGLETGAAIGIPLALSQAIGVSFYVAGFAEALVSARFPCLAGVDPRLIGLATLTVLAAVSTLNANIALKSQYFIMGAIVLSLVSFFFGSAPADLAALARETRETIGFWPVFAVFFPAVTGILSGVGMSGDLKDPGRSIPVGTIAAVLVGYAVYMSVPIVLHALVPDGDVLRHESNMMILAKCARWPWLILAGVWAATLSSAVGSFLCAPRVFQALSRDRLLPGFLGHGFGKSDDPRLASVLCFAIAATGVWLGDINAIAPILTLFNLSTYCLLNFAAACEEVMSNPSWRPTFRVRSFFSFAGAAGCLVAMFMISPGWTFIAIVVESLIYWLVVRRQLRAQWGDMRTGLRAALVGVLIRKLYVRRHKARNWRPNLLVMQDLPVRDVRLMELAREMSGGGLATVASVIRADAVQSVDEGELADSVVRTSRKLGFDCGVKVIAVEDRWAGMEELVRSYGFGPIVPNTVLMGLPKAEHRASFTRFVRELCRCRRNLVLAEGLPELPERGYVDLWWRGASSNAALMLALAFLLQRGKAWRRHPLRLTMIVRRRGPDEAERALADFLSRARLAAETRVIVAEDVPFVETIAAHSSDSVAAFLGLRAPEADEDGESYADYVLGLRAGLAGVPCPVFTLAREDVDFDGIFR